MTLQYCSDLHLEFRENNQFINQHPQQPKAEILLLAGDIVPFTEMDKLMRLLLVFILDSIIQLIMQCFPDDI